MWWAIVTDDLFAQNNSRDRFCCPPLSSRSRSRTATRRNRRSEHGSESRPARPPPFCTVRFRPLVQGCTVLKPPPAPAGKGCHRASRVPSPARSVARERRGRRRSDVPVGDESRHGQSHDDEALPRRRYRLVQFFSPEQFFRTPHDRGWVVRLIGCRGLSADNRGPRRESTDRLFRQARPWLARHRRPFGARCGGVGRPDESCGQLRRRR